MNTPIARKRLTKSVLAVTAAATLAVAGNVSVPSSTVTSGFATRLWYQSGFVGAPPFEANTATESSERRW